MYLDVAVCVCVVLCLEAELCEQLDCFKCAFSPHGGTRDSADRPKGARHLKSAEKHPERRNFTGPLSFGRLRNIDKPVAFTGD